MSAAREKLRRVLRIRNKTVRCFLAEFLGTFVLVCFGDGAVAQYVLGGQALDTGFLALNVAFGVAVTMGVYMSAGISGGHINPAVTLVMAILGKLKWRRLPFYFIAQYLGAFMGAACVFGVYYNGISHLDGGVRMVNQTAGIFATYPAGYVTIATGFFDQVLGTALLLLCIMAITDDKNHGAPKGVVAISIGLSVLGIGAAFGLNAGFALNPARDLGPRIFTAMAGWGCGVFTAHSHWAWVPVIAPHLGALLGAAIYELFVGLHTTDCDDSDDDDVQSYHLYNIKNDEKTADENVTAGSV